jgi:hypothetical protein
MWARPAVMVASADSGSEMEQAGSAGTMAEAGPDSVTARAVADRAGSLPL